ncbi:MAG: NAD(P)-binding protein [Ilumatobacter sp.]|nr:NAD(P)-binding protein [Ilumatobacter sp.]
MTGRVAGLVHVGVAGAGFSGAVIARALADAGHQATVFDPRDHVAGNCHTARDASTDVLVHVYGPHIFHTAHDDVWAYINRFGDMRPYNHRVKATAGGSVYSLPINLQTINQFFGTTMNPAEAERFIAAKSDRSIVDPQSFEDQALRFVGRELYEAFFAGYTKKQWGTDPTELPASILKRLPLRFNYDDSYFNHPYQAIPANGYTPIVEAILDHPGIEVRLSESLDPGADFDHVVWTGPIDAFFGHEHGRLAYRTLDFERASHVGDVQGCPVMNYCDADVPHTRITEHKHFAPWETHEGSITYREFSRLCGDDDIPYYPVRLVREKRQLVEYVERARTTAGVTFVGRLGTYRYLDMDVTIKEAMMAGEALLGAFASAERPPAFVADPLG